MSGTMTPQDVIDWLEAEAIDHAGWTAKGEAEYLSMASCIKGMVEALREADKLAGRLINRDVSPKIAGEILRYQIVPGSLRGHPTEAG